MHKLYWCFSVVICLHIYQFCKDKVNNLSYADRYNIKQSKWMAIIQKQAFSCRWKYMWLQQYNHLILRESNLKDGDCTTIVFLHQNRQNSSQNRPEIVYYARNQYALKPDSTPNYPAKSSKSKIILFFPKHLPTPNFIPQSTLRSIIILIKPCLLWLSKKFLKHAVHNTVNAKFLCTTHWIRPKSVSSSAQNRNQLLATERFRSEKISKLKQFKTRNETKRAGPKNQTWFLKKK